MNTRRHFLHRAAAATAVSALGLQITRAAELRPEGENMNFGLCTYMWGADWGIPDIIKNLKQLGIKGVELRVDHAHKVSPELTPEQRTAVRQTFEQAEITLLGMGTNAAFDSPDPEKLKMNIELAKSFIKLSHDIGGSGVKVKPNDYHDKENVPHEKTNEQIGKALAELGEFALGLGQEVRLEVHGSVGKSLASIRSIMETAKADNVRICWNSNPTDLEEGGLEKNFALVKDYVGQTTHVHELEDGKYPFDKLMKLFVDADYDGWWLLEASSKPEDKVKALGEQKALFGKMLAAARKK